MRKMVIVKDMRIRSLIVTENNTLKRQKKFHLIVTSPLKANHLQ
jgi:hypothetical protein